MPRIDRSWDDVGIGNWALLPLAGLYGLAWRSYEWLYRSGLRQAKEAYRPVLCVGSLAAGGSGKSPFSLYLCEKILQSGREVVLGMSGYGSPRSKNASFAPTGIALDAGEWGDEPALARERMPNVALVVGRDRVRAAELVSEHLPGAVLIMDDGFQHLPLRKHLSVLLDPPRKNSFCFPAGPLREPRTGLSRADIVLPSSPFRVLETAIVTDGASHVELRGEQVNLLSAIALPRRFRSSMEALGATILTHVELADHDRLTSPSLLDGFESSVPLVVTAKDWMKLRHRKDVFERKIWVADIRVHVEPEAEFVHWLYGRLDEISAETD